MSQHQLTRQLGVDSSTISHWENGWYQPTGESVMSLCDIHEAFYFGCV
ncbi:MAG: helix-turn-helix transcriptional regulator [Phycisphaeraceae bacterium]|nr:helix-turn-helix transcriptional regulator [Phycisphaeraceae bacterium]